MKEGIHPKYGKAVIRCACGETFTTGSTKSELRVEICSKCHPFFTGKQKFVDTAGRVEKFKRKYGMEEDNEDDNREDKDGSQEAKKEESE